MRADHRTTALPSLFDDPEALRAPRRTELAAGAVVLHAFALGDAAALVEAVAGIAAAAPFRRMTTPGGHVMSVAMTNCGAAGWVTDERGYRYTGVDPDSGRDWPTMPPLFVALAERAATEAGFPDFHPDACLVNRYEPGAKMGLHQDRNERAFTEPIVSVSLGLPARFLFGGLSRSDPVQRVTLEHGDVVVWGGPVRLAFRGVDTLKAGVHERVGRCRLNLTFRRAG